MDRNRLINLYNGTATIDEKTGGIKTYENWLEGQLIKRVERIKELDQKMTHPFQLDMTTSSATKCICGKEKYEHINQ